MNLIARAYIRWHAFIVDFVYTILIVKIPVLLKFQFVLSCFSNLGWKVWITVVKSLNCHLSHSNNCFLHDRFFSHILPSQYPIFSITLSYWTELMSNLGKIIDKATLPHQWTFQNRIVMPLPIINFRLSTKILWIVALKDTTMTISF